MVELAAPQKLSKRLEDAQKQMILLFAQIIFGKEPQEPVEIKEARIAKRVIEPLLVEFNGIREDLMLFETDLASTAESLPPRKIMD